MDYTIILIIFLVEELCGWCWGRDVVRLIISIYGDGVNCYGQGYFCNVNGEWKYLSAVSFSTCKWSLSSTLSFSRGQEVLQTLKWSHGSDGTDSEDLGHSSPYKVVMEEIHDSVKVIRWCIYTFLLWFHNHYMYGPYSQKAEMVQN